MYLLSYNDCTIDNVISEGYPYFLAASTCKSPRLYNLGDFIVLFFFIIFVTVAVSGSCFIILSASSLSGKYTNSSLLTAFPFSSVSVTVSYNFPSKAAGPYVIDTPYSVFGTKFCISSSRVTIMLRIALIARPTDAPVKLYLIEAALEPFIPRR